MPLTKGRSRGRSERIDSRISDRRIGRMRTISSNLAKQTFGRVLETAQREPVLVKKHRLPTAVILSVAEYDRLKMKQPESIEGKPPSTEAKASVAKSLPVVPLKAGASPSRLLPQEMVELVHEADAELDA